MRYFASNTIQYPPNKNIRNDACSFSVNVNADLPFISANLTNKKEIMSLGFRVNNVIYPKSSGKIWGKYKKCY